MPKLSIPGVKDDGLSAAPSGAGAFLDASVECAYGIEGTRGAGPRGVPEDAQDTDVVELSLEGGARRWIPVSELPDALGMGITRAGSDPDLMVLPTTLSDGDPSRGLGDWTIKGLRLLRARISDELLGRAGGAAAEGLALALEGQLVRDPGLYGVGSQTLTLREANLKEGCLHLLLIHGTASRTASAFAGLGAVEQSGLWKRLERAYGGGILAFEHHTLTQSPLQNAIDLVRALPHKGARLHVVSHSRGGLVGELLCRARRSDCPVAFTDEEIRSLQVVFEERGSGDEEAKRLKEFTELLREKSPIVERFVPVGATLRGTTLAGRKLDRWASVVLNLLKRLSLATGQPAVERVAEFTTAFLLGMVKARGDWTKLPGLAAQMPDSPLVALLNRPGPRIAGQLSAIAGDAEPDGILRRIATWTADAFYGEDNDLVVQTSSMQGGSDRGLDGRVFRSAGTGLHHCNYFATPTTLAALDSALLGTPREAGFEAIRLDEPELKEEFVRSRSSTGARPVLFILPGIMGSHLAIGDDRVWLEYLDLMWGGIRKIHIDATSVSPAGVIGKTYDDVTRYMLHSHDVRRFAYDWRLSLTLEADRLAEKVRAVLAETDQPIRLLAHSMGGLLARLMVARHPDVWKEVCRRRGSRLVMLGTPSEGSFSIPRVLTARDGTLKRLALIDVKSSPAQVLGVISRFTGLLELLPSPNPGLDLFAVDVWEKLLAASREAFPIPKAEDLAQAALTRKLLAESPLDPAHMIYVAGWAPETPSALAIEGNSALFFSTAQGDGRVPWATGIPSALRASTWYMPTSHGDLPAYEAGFAGLHDLLTDGRTDRLSQLPPATRGADEDQPLPDDEVTVYPSQQDLLHSVMGMDVRASTGAPVTSLPTVRVSVCHGDVGFAGHPVFIGHYEGDPLVSAERALDQWLEGELSLRYSSGFYPGSPETSAVVFNRPNRPLNGGVVVGLGEVGGLSGGTLERTMQAGIMKFALALSDRAREEGRAPAPEFGISPVLIGTGESGVPLYTALRSILSAVKQANLLLAAAPRHHPMRVAEVEFIELYRDRALEAAGMVSRISAEDPGVFVPAAEVTARRGGLTRDYPGEEKGWLWRLQIEEDPARMSAGQAGPGSCCSPEEGETPLRFTVPTLRARVASETLAAHRRLAEALVQEAIGSTRDDPELSETLFELLVPNPIKDQAPEKRDVLLLLDEKAARFPWELLKDPATRGEPMSLQSQMIRQLIAASGRHSITGATGSRVLVIGDPGGTHLPRLPGAEKEAREVTRLLKAAAYDVREVIGSSCRDILRALFANREGQDMGYRMIHVAGHGEYDPVRSAGSGVVIGDRLHLTPETFNQLRQVPEVVFLNCCHLGLIEPDQRWRPHLTAANLGTQLISMGVRAVVVAGWAVNDAAALTFSVTFYRQMLQGSTFGAAVLAARRATRTRHPDTNTWGAYQCYGDPQYVLREGMRAPGDGQWSFAHPTMAITALTNLLSRCRTVRIHRGDVLKEELSAIVPALPSGWSSRSDVAEALGVVYGELGLFDEAIRYLELAARCERPSASVASQEKCANLRARRAARDWLTRDRLEYERGLADANGDPKLISTAEQLHDERRHQRLSEIDQAVSTLERVMDLFGPSSERLCLIGSANKRRAMIVGSSGERTKALAAAREGYQNARKYALSHTGSEDWLALTNLLALRVVRQLRSRRSPKEWADFEADYESATGLVMEAAGGIHPYFGISATAELALARSLVDKTLDQQVDRVAAGYESAFNRAGSIAELLSTLDQMTFYIEMLRPVRAKDVGGQVLALDKLRGRMARLMDTWSVER